AVKRLYMSFFVQAEDGIRDRSVTGVQTCALPISGAERGDPDHSQIYVNPASISRHGVRWRAHLPHQRSVHSLSAPYSDLSLPGKIGRASRRDRAWMALTGGERTH